MRFFILLFSILSLVSCSAKRLPPTILIEENYQNRLVKRGCAISLPDDFVFFLKKKEIRNVVTRFRGPSVSGIVEILNYSFAMENEKLAAYYADRILEKAKERTISKVASFGRDIYIISAVSENGKREMKTVLWLIEQKKLFILQLVADRGFFKRNPKLLKKIISGWKEEKKGLNLRIKKGVPKFISKNSDFFWYNDMKDGRGFLIYDRKRKIRISLSKDIISKNEGKLLIYNSSSENRFGLRELKSAGSKYRIFQTLKNGCKIRFKVRKDQKIEDLGRYLNNFFSDLLSRVSFKTDNADS